jgi:hypothetical protein
MEEGLVAQIADDKLNLVGNLSYIFSASRTQIIENPHCVTIRKQAPT